MSNLRPFARRPHNETAHDELKGFQLLTSGSNYQAPHLYVTTSTGRIEVLPLSDEDLLKLHKQVSALVTEHFRKYVEGK